MKTEHISVFKKFKKHRVLVIGDFILDQYLEGSCTRLAPEASVPVVDILSKRYCLGGAANSAANLSGLGAEVCFCTITGQDAGSDEARKLLKAAGIGMEFIVTDPGRTTIVKTRVSAPSHTLVRFDEGTEHAPDPETEARLVHHLHEAYFQCDAVLVADYDKGILTPTVISELKKLRLKEDKFIAVDSKRGSAFAQIGPSLIKPNYEEAIKLLALPHNHHSRAEQLIPYGAHFFDKTNAELIALTLDEDGALFFSKGEFIHRSFAPRVRDPNVSGAGDTFISTMLLSLISGASVPDAAELATTAAGIAIAEKDTAICSARQLADSLADGDKAIHLNSQLRQKCSQLHAQGKKIVFTNGCFDILHSGHVNYLKQASEMGDILIVGLNNDESIRRLKGRDRPVNTLDNRIEVLSGLACVDYVVPFGNARDDTPDSLIRIIRPDVFVKGGDYKDKHLPEEKLLRKIGCKIAFVPFVYDQSTTKLIRKVRGQGHLHIAVAN